MKKCLRCGNVIPRGNNYRTKKFCSRPCYNASKPFTKEQQENAFWSKVDKNGPNGCWLWTASCKERGYGQYMLKGKMYRAHRLAWLLSGHKLPDRPLELAHTCDTRICVNPAHLFVATHDENMADCKAKRRHTHGERNIHAKLTDAQVIEIRQRFKFYTKRRTNASELAPDYGVRRDVIYMAGTRRTWKHIP